MPKYNQGSLDSLILEFQERSDMLNGKPPSGYIQMCRDLKLKIKEHGFEQQDQRLNRMVYALPGDFLVIKDPLIMEYLRYDKPLAKYRDDWHRMITSFLDACSEARKDLNSRQLLVLNTHDFRNVKQCFNTFQFVHTHRNEFDLYVYQRSADLEKLKDDLTFFRHVADAFEEQVDTDVTKIVVVYGNIHFTKE